jgi:hypothetical protein
MQMMTRGVRTRPTWWLLYVIGALLVGLVGLAEISLPAGAARVTLETLLVVVMFGLMLRWVRANRVRIELAAVAPTRRETIEAALRDGAVPAPRAGVPVGPLARRPRTLS